SPDSRSFRLVSRAATQALTLRPACAAWSKAALDSARAAPSAASNDLREEVRALSDAAGANPCTSASALSSVEAVPVLRAPRPGPRRSWAPLAFVSREARR